MREALLIRSVLRRARPALLAFALAAALAPLLDQAAAAPASKTRVKRESGEHFQMGGWYNKPRVWGYIGAGIVGTTIVLWFLFGRSRDD